MVGRALIGTLALTLVAGTAWGEEPELRAQLIVDPYAEPEPRIVEVVDPYAAPANRTLELDLERVCGNYCLASRNDPPPVPRLPPPRLPPPHQTEYWGGSEPEERKQTLLGTNQQALGGLVLAAAAFAGIGLMYSAQDEDLNLLHVAASTGVGAGLVLGIALIVDGHDGKTEVRMASAALRR